MTGVELIFSETDLQKTIRDYDYTRKAVRHLYRTVTGDDFRDMDVVKIYHCLLSEMELVSFKDYLKRYLYEEAGFDCPFNEVSDQDYAEVIMDSFEQNMAPHSFTPTTVRWKVTVQRWLTQDNVQRSTVLLLGFGLRMSDKEVSEFLTKVLKETDFDPEDPWEMICRYCFAADKRYAEALRLFKISEELQKSKSGESVTEEVLNADMTEENLIGYLRYLHQKGTWKQRQTTLRDNFLYLYRKCCELIACMYQDDADINASEKSWKAEDIRPSDVEKVLCDGMPVTKNRNLKKMAGSLLYRHFEQRRLTRQRLEGILKGERTVDRYDLITLQFFISSQNEDDEPAMRTVYFIDDINDILESCGMLKIYLANPYEAFVLMCLLTDYPLMTYYDVWQKSYEENGYDGR